MSDQSHEVYLVVQCFNPGHRRVNDQPANDPKCQWCAGLGLVRVLRDHVPVVVRIGQTWSRPTTLIEQLADLDALEDSP